MPIPNLQVFRDLPQTTKLLLIEHFVRIATERYLRSKELQNYLTCSVNLKMDLGIEKRDFKPTVQDIMDELVTHLLQLVVQLQSTSSEENKILQSAHIGMFLVPPFEFVLQVGSSIIGNLARKQLLKSRLQSADTSVKDKHEELTKCKKGAFKALEEENQEVKKRSKCLTPDFYEKMHYTADILKEKLREIEEFNEQQKIEKRIRASRMEKLLQEFGDLEKDHELLTENLDLLSHHATLPHNLVEARATLSQRMEHLAVLKQQISLLEES